MNNQCCFILYTNLLAGQSDIHLYVFIYAYVNYLNTYKRIEAKVPPESTSISLKSKDTLGRMKANEASF